MAGVYFPESFRQSTVRNYPPALGPTAPAILGLDQPGDRVCRDADTVTFSPAALRALQASPNGDPGPGIADMVGYGATATSSVRPGVGALSMAGRVAEATAEATASAEGVARGASTLGRLGSGALRAAGPVGVAAAVVSSGIEIHQAVTDPRATRQQRAERVGGAIGSGGVGLALGAAGAEWGAIVGTIGGPAGMIVGGVAGGLAGAVAGSSLGRWVGRNVGGLVGVMR